MFKKTMISLAGLIYMGAFLYPGVQYQIERNLMIQALEKEKFVAGDVLSRVEDKMARLRLASDLREDLAAYRMTLTSEEVTALADKIFEVSDKYSIPPRLLFALIAHESSWNRKAVSEQGAVGLMQLLPSTAKQVARELHIVMPRGAALDDPELNIELGSYYLAQMIDRFDNLQHALTAYNAGPNRVASQLRKDRLVSSHFATTILANAVVD